MLKNNDELLKRLLATFRIEADEHFRAISAGIFSLEKAPAGGQRTAIVETIFRDAHSLKGAARAVNLTAIESVCQSLESVFAALKGERLGVSPPLFDLLHETVAALGELLCADPGSSGTHQLLVAALTRRLDDALRGRQPEPEAAAQPTEHITVHPQPVAPAPASDTVRVSTAKLDVVMRQVEELLMPRLAAVERARELRDTAAAVAVWKEQRLRIQPAIRMVERSPGSDPQVANQDSERGSTLDSSSRGRQELPNLLAYLDSEQLHLKMLEDRLASLIRSAERDQRMLVGMADGLLHEVKEMQLLPFASLLEMLPRVARELAREQGKHVELATHGGEIEVDRRILEAMKHPLIHLLRNSVDHGVEKPAVREATHKPSHGTITLTISQKDSSKVEILMADDGAGIDVARVKTAASKLGVVSAEDAERLGEQEALALIFQSGVTTSPIITDVSGRGLGLAIVREKVEQLGGSIVIETHPTVGTAFRIILPLMLANVRGVLVRASGQLFVIPAANFERVTRVANEDIRTVENRETISLDGQAVSLAWLSDVLELPRAQAPGLPADKVLLVILGLGPGRIAFRVDEILAEQEVLVKSLGPQLARVRNVAGASVLGTGQVVPVLNVSDLLISAVMRTGAPRAPEHQSSAGIPQVAGKLSILVVEDSITSRSLLMHILESAGYRVTTAVDGADGYMTLKTGTFDLVVSDVEMPRMDGFELTAKVRSDKELAELPVVLVTSLESREHRERGIDVGANAYVVKSSFDQSNLLEIIQRLI